MSHMVCKSTKKDFNTFIIPCLMLLQALMQTLSSITLCLEDQFYLKWNEIRILPELWTVLLAESKDNNVAVHLIRR